MKRFCTKTIPIFRIFDLAKAKEFYLDWLGFHIDWEHRFSDKAPIYLQVSRDDLVLHLSEHHGDCCPGAKILIHTELVEEIYQELIEKQYRYNHPDLEMTPWDTKCFEVIDPFGNRISFNQYQESDVT